ILHGCNNAAGELEKSAMPIADPPGSTSFTALHPAPVVRRGGITGWLSQMPTPVFIAYAITASFGGYFCMYAFRQPFDAVQFANHSFLGTAVTLKTACVIAQIVGYMLSKYLGAKYCSEVRTGTRALLLVGLILVAELALFVFAVVPENWKPAAMLLNGLP